MSEPNFWDNADRRNKVIAQLKPLNALLKPYQDLSTAVDDAQAMAELCAEDDSLEPELERDLGKIAHQLDGFELKAMLSGPADANNAFIRIQAGTGGTDACDFAEMIMRMYLRWAAKQGFTVEEHDLQKNPEAGIQSVTLHVIGEYAYGYLQGEVGVHRLVRISPFNAQGLRQTSFVAVEVTPELDDTIDIEVKPDDLEKQTFTSGGPGGQHQNKTQSGVRLIHLPTGVRGESRTERSQHKNYDNALKLLKARLYAIEDAKRRSVVERAYDEKGEVSWGNQRRNYVLQPYTLAKDVKLEVETPQVQQVLDGEIDLFIQANLRQKAEREHKKKE